MKMKLLVLWSLFCASCFAGTVFYFTRDIPVTGTERYTLYNGKYLDVSRGGPVTIASADKFVITKGEYAVTVAGTEERTELDVTKSYYRARTTLDEGRWIVRSGTGEIRFQFGQASASGVVGSTTDYKVGQSALSFLIFTVLWAIGWGLGLGPRRKKPEAET